MLDKESSEASNNNFPHATENEMEGAILKNKEQFSRGGINNIG